MTYKCQAQLWKDVISHVCELYLSLFIFIYLYLFIFTWRSCTTAVPVLYPREFHGENVKYSMETPWDSVWNTPWNFQATRGKRESSMESSWNAMETPWKISRVFQHGIPWGIKPGLLFGRIALYFLICGYFNFGHNRSITRSNFYHATLC